MRVNLPSRKTTRFTRAITSIADIEALERLPYDSLVPARNLYQLFEATAELHPERQALSVLAQRGSGDVSLTHRELLAEISRAATGFGAARWNRTALASR